MENTFSVKDDQTRYLSATILMQQKYDKVTKSLKPEITVGLFLVMLGTSSIPPRYEVYGKITDNVVPSWERAPTQHDQNYGL